VAAYYLSLLWAAFRRTVGQLFGPSLWRAVLKVVLAAGVLLSLTWTGQAATVSEKLLGSLPVWAVLLLAFLVLFGANLLWEPYRRSGEDRKTINDLRDKLKVFETPALEVLCTGPEPAYYHEVFGLRRISVRNIAGKTVHGVTVEMESTEPPAQLYVQLPVPLHWMHDNPAEGAPPSRSFDLVPCQRAFVDVLSHDEGGTAQRLYCYRIAQAILVVDDRISPETTRIDLLITGRDVPPCRKSIRLRYRLGHLDFEEG
jgi:hypothetical protein